MKVELSSQRHLYLHITIRSRAKTQATFYKSRLPWGNYNSMMLIAVTPGEHFVKRGYPVDDPSPEKISMEPNEEQSGELNLQMRLIGLDATLKKSDIYLFWAYEPPNELNLPRRLGGWVLIPQQK
jgi:hypothetical protein